MTDSRLFNPASGIWRLESGIRHLASDKYPGYFFLHFKFCKAIFRTYESNIKSCRIIDTILIGNEPEMTQAIVTSNMKIRAKGGLGSNDL
ncbi:MAG: hypothetical protein GXO75_20730 [Calditrichaeota bacterium]|nr:hypothetical protein [Calditrichota bacterium]